MGYFDVLHCKSVGKLSLAIYRKHGIIQIAWFDFLHTCTCTAHNALHCFSLLPSVQYICCKAMFLVMSVYTCTCMSVYLQV